MAQPLSLDTISIKQIVQKLQQFEELKFALLASIPEQALKYGSSLWWDKVELMADSDTQKGNIRKYRTMKDLIKDLHS